MALDFLPYPLASRVLYRDKEMIITDVDVFSGSYCLDGGFNWVNHKDVQLLFPPSTSCDWNRMLAKFPELNTIESYES